MKKSPRRLSVHRETLSVLAAERTHGGDLTGRTSVSVQNLCFHTAELTCFGCPVTGPTTIW
jgi:hypothetical protein